MTERGDETPGPHDPAGGHADGRGPAEEVGSLGEEATRLLGALSDWARDQGGQAPTAPAGPTSHHDTPGDTTDGPTPGSLGTVVGRLVEAARVVVGDLGRDLEEHLDAGPPECAWCPVCRTAHLVRQTSPEVRAHLGAAGASLLQAAAGLLAGADRPPRPDETQRPGTTGPEEDRT